MGLGDVEGEGGRAERAARDEAARVGAGPHLAPGGGNLPIFAHIEGEARVADEAGRAAGGEDGAEAAAWYGWRRAITGARPATPTIRWRWPAPTRSPGRPGCTWSTTTRRPLVANSGRESCRERVGQTG